MNEKKQSALVRLNKLIADSGLASRRAADRLIADGLVTVNGKKVYELGIKVDPSKDKVTVEGSPLRKKFENMYIMFHKPRGVLTTMSDPFERPTIKDFLDKVPARVFPVGRLDWDSEGLLILTNDGDYANRITHPKEEVTKTYLVKVDGHPTDEDLAKLRKGVSIIGGKASAKHVEKVKRGKDKYAWLKVIISEGRNRQIRKMFEKIGFDVLKLQRVAIGTLRLGNLERGDLVFMNEEMAAKVFIPDDPEALEKRLGQRKLTFKKETKLKRSGLKGKPRSKKREFKPKANFDFPK
jgi:23S rRNA pseudouridine2605 synthase